MGRIREKRLGSVVTDHAGPPFGAPSAGRPCQSCWNSFIPVGSIASTSRRSGAILASSVMVSEKFDDRCTEAHSRMVSPIPPFARARW